ncbi:unnamed protein product [Microthlaspi erraticum]|uniref:Reverse transcriptase zinc-binding domain-containing protein n=1 Tax=Microthlaspi erraticum TaxID=1685480 RepID=A0A6D2J9M1_9BRAS|nr:unnamed protein product [Microthlaspi erraticum]CAA7036325.1 unnamed protein product [Microthlaspi erraticum]
MVLVDIESVVGLSASSFPIRYLSLPLCTRKLSVTDCDPLITQIRKKLNSWTHQILSMAGRYTLLSTVIPGIVGFWSLAFFLPKAVIRCINSLTSAFFWHGTTDSAKGAKVAWSDLSFPKKEGDLGLRVGSVDSVWMIHYIGCDGPSIMVIPLFSTISDLITPQGWSLPPTRLEKQLNLHAFVTTLQPNTLTDQAV